MGWQVSDVTRCSGSGKRGLTTARRCGPDEGTNCARLQAGRGWSRTWLSEGGILATAADANYASEDANGDERYAFEPASSTLTVLSWRR